MLRRFLLVGVFIVGPAQRGSVMQLAAATLLCLVYLAVQAFAQPYDNLSDDLLAIVVSFMLMLFFLCCLILKYHSLTDLGELQERMSVGMKADYLVQPSLITFILMACVLGAIIFCGVIFVVQAGVEAARARQDAREKMARRLRFLRNDKEVEAPPMDKHGYHLFLSHVYAISSHAHTHRQLCTSMPTLPNLHS